MEVGGWGCGEHKVGWGKEERERILIGGLRNKTYDVVIWGRGPLL